MQWLKDWCRAVSTPEERKPEGVLRNYRTISIIVHASKVLLKIIKCRTKLHYDGEMAEEQTGLFGRKRNQRTKCIRDLGV